MFLVMGITGKVWGIHSAASAEAQGKNRCRSPCARSRESSELRRTEVRWELVDGDWNEATAIAAALKAVEGAFDMLPTVWAPLPDCREAKGVDCELCRGGALTKRSAAAGGCAVPRCGANRTTQGGVNITALSALGARSSQPAQLSGRICARWRLFESFLSRFTGRPGRNTVVFYRSYKPEIDNGRAQTTSAQRWQRF